MSDGSSYPVDFTVPVDDEYRSRGLAALGLIAFAKAILLIPHLFLLLAYAIAVQFVVWIGYWYILITGSKPFWVENFELIFLEWASRVFAWFTSTTDVFPTYGTDEHHPAQVTVEEAPQPQSRLLAVLGILFIRTLLAIPHLFVLLWLTLGTLFLAWYGFLVILVTGSLPLALHFYFIGFHRWWARTWAWIAALTDEYPPFTLKP
ncbi:MAG: DUF4389 domain-containing protein [Acidimicrobiia bacterium]|nr:MAG: DUF4389 domain-containing protein [Acidimicrobiia bacterium]